MKIKTPIFFPQQRHNNHGLWNDNHHQIFQSPISNARLCGKCAVGDLENPPFPSPPSLSYPSCRNHHQHPNNPHDTVCYSKTPEPSEKGWHFRFALRSFIPHAGYSLNCPRPKNFPAVKNLRACNGYNLKKSDVKKLKWASLWSAVSGQCSSLYSKRNH